MIMISSHLFPLTVSRNSFSTVGIIKNSTIFHKKSTWLFWLFIRLEILNRYNHTLNYSSNLFSFWDSGLSYCDVLFRLFINQLLLLFCVLTFLYFLMSVFTLLTSCNNLRDWYSIEWNKCGEWETCHANYFLLCLKFRTVNTVRILFFTESNVFFFCIKNLHKID